MQTPSREQARTDLLNMLQELREDWEYTDDITEDTGIFRDLGFESIDAVALGSTIEDHFGLTLPFAEFLTKARDQDLEDITVGHLLDFVLENLGREAKEQKA